MKKLPLLFLSIIALFILSCGGNDDSNSNTDSTATTMTSATTETAEASSSNMEKGEFKSGYIAYKSSMANVESTMKCYFDDFGKTFAVEASANVQGKQMTTRTFMKDGWTYVLNLGEKTGMKMKEEEDNENGSKNLIYAAQELTKDKKSEGTEEILGKKCDIYTDSSVDGVAKIWVWKNIVMKQVISSPNSEETAIVEVTEINFDTNIPSDKFEVPADIKVQEMNMNFGGGK